MRHLSAVVEHTYGLEVLFKLPCSLTFMDCLLTGAQAAFERSPEAYTTALQTLVDSGLVMADATLLSGFQELLDRAQSRADTHLLPEVLLEVSTTHRVW